MICETCKAALSFLYVCHCGSCHCATCWDSHYLGCGKRVYPDYNLQFTQQPPIERTDIP